jgi:hypothetical protein
MLLMIHPHNKIQLYHLSSYYSCCCFEMVKIWIGENVTNLQVFKMQAGLWKKRHCHKIVIY